MNNENLEMIEALKPFGTDFKEPLLCLRNPKVKSKYIIKNTYPKFTFENNISAISFNEVHKNKEFELMLGHMRKDNYRANSISFVIEELI